MLITFFVVGIDVSLNADLFEKKYYNIKLSYILWSYFMLDILVKFNTSYYHNVILFIIKFKNTTIYLKKIYNNFFE